MIGGRDLLSLHTATAGMPSSPARPLREPAGPRERERAMIQDRVFQSLSQPAPTQGRGTQGQGGV